MTVPILRETQGLEGWWQFFPTEERGAAIIVVRFRRPGRADLITRYGVVFLFDLLDGLVARGETGAAMDGARAAVRALELKHAGCREAAAAKELRSVEGAGHSPSVAAPAGAGLPDLPPAGDPFLVPQQGSSPVGGCAGGAAGEDSSP